MGTRPSDRPADVADALAYRLSQNPGDREAYRALRDHYRSVGDFASLANLIAGYASFTQDDKEASRAYQEVAEVLERSLNDPKRAEGFYRRAVQRDASNLDASEGLQGLLARAGRLPELTELISGQLETLERQRADPRDIAVLYYRLGELWSKHFERKQEALGHYRRAYELDPKLLRAIYEARLLYLALGDKRSAAGLYEKEAASEADPARKSLLLRELSSVCSELDDLDGAISALDRARVSMPQDLELAHLLAAELLRRSKTLDERQRTADLDRLASVLCELASALPDDEASPFLRSALEHAPWHNGALSELERRTPPEALAQTLAPHWVAYLTHNPSGEGVLDRRLSLARAYASAGQVEDAIFCIEPAAERGIPEALRLLAELRGTQAQDELVSDPATELQHRASTTKPAPPDEDALRQSDPDLVTQIADMNELDALRHRARGSAQPPARTSTRPAPPAGAPTRPAPPPSSVTRPAPPPPTRRNHAITRPVPPPSRAITRPVAPEQSATPVDLESSDLSLLHRELDALAAHEQPHDAADVARRILELDLADADAFAFLDRYYRRERDFAHRAELLAQTGNAEALPIPTRKQRLREAANLYETRLSDVDAALATHRQLSALEPENEDLARGLRRLLERAERWEELCALLADDAHAQREPAAKLTLLRRLAEVHRRERGDREAAARVLAELVELDPDDRASRIALTDDLIALTRYREAAELIERRVRETPSRPERLPLLRQLASLFENQAGDREAAFAVYERVLEILPDDAHALDRMEEIDEAAGNHERLLSTLKRRAQHAAPAQAADLHVRMATVAEADLLDQDRATSYLRRALELAPGSSQILMALSNAYERAGRDAELLALLREREASERNTKLRVDVQRRIGRLLSQRMDDDDGAAEAFAKVLEVTEDREALSFMERRARARDDRAALADVLGRLAELEDEPSARHAHLLERAEQLEAIGKPLDAIEAIARVLIEQTDSDSALLVRLSDLCDAANDQRGLSRVLEHRLRSATTPEGKADAARALADLYETKLADESRALRALGEWSQAAPSDPAPRRRLAVVFEHKRRYKDLVGVLDELASVETSEAARSAALQSAAELCHTKLKDDAGAFARIARRAEHTPPEQPLDPGLIALARRLAKIPELAALCEAQGRHDELFALLRERIAAETDANDKAALQRRLANALIDHRQDEAAALEVYEALLASRDDSEALRFVQAWSIRHDDPNRLEKALARLAKLESSHVDKRDLLFERGRLLCARLDRARDAIADLEEALAIDGRFEPALDELIGACKHERNHEKLAPALERKLGLAVNADDKLETLRALFEIYDGPLHDEKRALHTLDRWVALDRTDPEPLRRIRAYHARAGRSRELVATLDLLAEHEPQHEARIAAQVAAAETLAGPLRDPAAAFDRLAELVTLADPEVDRVIDAAATATHREDALYDLFEAAERYEDAVERLERAARAANEPAKRARWLLRAATLADRKLGDEPRALEAYERLLEIEEHPAALRFKQARALQANDPAELADVLGRLAAIETDPREKRDLAYERAHLLNVRLGRAAEAVAVLREIVRATPDFEPALDELVSAADAANDPEAQADALSLLLEREREPAQRANLAERLADLCERALTSPERAVAALRAWAEAVPDDLTPLRRLRALFTRTAAHAALVACLDAIAARAEDARERVDAQLTAAGLLRDALGDPDAAFARLTALTEAGNATADRELRALAFATDRHEALAEIYARMLRHDELVDLLRGRADATNDANAKADLYLRCARILAGDVGDELAATEAYREVIGLREDPEALDYLRLAAERLDDIDGLEDLLRRLAAVIDDRERKRDLMLARALLLNDRLDRTADAVEVLRQIVTTLDPSCMPAIEELIAASEAVGNLPALAQGLERKLVLTRDASERAALASHLADLYEGELDNAELATEALRRCCEADPENVGAQRRLRARLVQQKRPEELLAVLDVLAKLETTKAARHEAVLAAAKLAHEGLGDAKGAFLRLAALVQAGDGEAEHLAEAICKNAGLGRELAGVYIRRAQQGSDRDDARVSWRHVVRIHESWLNEPNEAFEASLRLLALDTRDRAQLDEVDRLGILLQAFPRIAQVYAKLVKDTERPHEQIELLLRLANIFEVQARDPNTALELLMQACKLGSADDLVLERAEALTRRLGNHTELLWLLEHRAQRAQTPELAIAALLEAARTADIGQADREQANACLRRALELTERAPALAGAIEELAGELDRARPSLGKDDARRALVRAHLELCEHATPAFRDALVLRAARFVASELHDEAGAFDLLRQGTATAPPSDALLDALGASAQRLGRLDALNAHLQRVADRATDKTDKRNLLLRRAAVLDQHMGRYDQAAQAYERVLELDPEDEATATRLFACLRQAGRYRELLHAFDRRLARTQEPRRKLPLMRQMATIWEIELKNRASAMEVWNEVRAIAPEDEEAERAIARLATL